VRLTACLVIAGVLGGCSKDRAEPRPAPAVSSTADARAPEPAETPPPPPIAPPAAAGLKTPWGEPVPASHRHPKGDWVSVFDLDGLYDLAVRGLPAINAAGEIAYASSVTLGEMDYSTLSVVVSDPAGKTLRHVVIFDANADGASRAEPTALATVRARARAVNRLLAGSSWRPMVELESTGVLEAGAAQTLASADGAATARFKEPELTVAIAGKTLSIDGRAWSRRGCPGTTATANVLLSGVWVDLETGAVVARIGYEGEPGCGNDPIFAVARGR
jgi:hypothetical protein